MSEPVVFRGLRNRTLADQQRAIEDGYTSMYAYAIDELGGLLLELTRRVDELQSQCDEINERLPYTKFRKALDDAGT